MRGLFSLLFGASMLLVIERAKAAGESPVRVHFSRMAVLLCIGLLHRYLIWWGDILAHYALVGAIAFLFTRLSARQLLLASLASLALAFYNNLYDLRTMSAAASRDTPDALAIWNNFAWYFGLPPRDWIDGQVAAYRGSWSQRIAWNWTHLDTVLGFLKSVGPETLAAMLLGMAGYRSGYLKGEWSQRDYLICALLGLGLAIPAYLLLGINSMVHGFDQRSVLLGSFVASEPFRLLGAGGYASLFILLIKPEGWLGVRLAAVGRAAFTNYLGTSVLVTMIFYGWGLGQYARWNRAEIHIIPPLVWALMLIWSKPWLERYRYGPLEWFWRTLARGRPQTMRRGAQAAHQLT